MGQLIKLIIVMGLAAMVCPARVYESCSPDPDCSAAAPGDKVEDPKDCHSYYFCLPDGAPSDVPVPCGDGEFFDTTAGDCAAETDPCKPSCSGTCQVACNNTYDLVADFNDCTHYFICLPSGPEEFACPADRPFFSGEDCTEDKAACCQADCDMNNACTGPGVQVPDPNDCHSAGVCVNESYAFPFTCQGGCIFDTQNNRCDDSDPCETVCEPMCGGSTGGPSGDPVNPTSLGSTIASGVSTPASGVSTPAPGSSTPAGGSTMVSGGITTTGGGGTTGPCVDSMECTASGFFAKCTTCDPTYFSCDSNSGTADIGKCSGDLVFNPDPAYPYCMRPENCPFHPPH